MHSVIFTNIYRKCIMYCIFVTTVLAVIFVVLRYKERKQWQEKYFSFNEKESIYSYYNNIISHSSISMISSHLLEQNTVNIINRYVNIHFLDFIIEILVLLIFPWPFYDTIIIEEHVIEEETVLLYRFMSDYLFLGLMLRLIYIYKGIFMHSKYADAYS